MSSLREENGKATASARVIIGGRAEERTMSAEIEGPILALDYKRTISTIVKTTIYDAVVPFLDAPPVWGSLTGVRPAKLARGLVERGKRGARRPSCCATLSCVPGAHRAHHPCAAATAMEMDKDIGENDISLYVGIPFCPSRCYYCSFVSSTTAQSGNLIEPYLETLCARNSRNRGARARGWQVRPEHLHRRRHADDARRSSLHGSPERSRDTLIFRAFARIYGRGGPPGYHHARKARGAESAGVGRVSINPQSMEDSVLAAIGRKHAASDVLRAFDEARQAGFREINMDVIAGLTGDTPETFAHTIDTLIGLAPENITVHPRHQARRGLDRQGGGRRTARRGVAYA